MSHFIAIQHRLHQHAGILKAGHYGHALKDVVAPVSWEELSHVTVNLPLCFVRNHSANDTPVSEPTFNSGSLKLVALQGLQPNQNLMVHPKTKQWLFGYIPAYYRGYPFALIPEQGTQKSVLCFDFESDLFQETIDENGQAFYDTEGKPSAFLTATLEFLQKRSVGFLNTQKLVDEIARCDLLSPWKIQLKTSDQSEPIALNGVFKVDESKLRALPPETLHKLVKSGAMVLIYAQLLSEKKLVNLQKAFQAHVQFSKQDEATELDLDTFFGEEDDSLKF